jgi:hypothetical protein
MALLFLELDECLEPFRVTSHESSPTEQNGVLAHAMRLGKSSGIEDSLLLGVTLSE